MFNAEYWNECTRLAVVQVARYAKEDALGKYTALLTLSPM